MNALGLTISAADRRLLLSVAADAIAAELGGHVVPVPLPEPDSLVDQPGASFVTLRRGNDLLGCIGSLEPRRPLLDDVAANAVASAFDDPRLPPLTERGYESMSITVSVLSPLVEIRADDYADLADSLTDHPTGLLVVAGRRRATFLPSVWEQLPTASRFLEALWDKAGLAPREWPADLGLWRYETVEFTDEGPRSLP